ncbi:MAG: hypothetical protein ACI9C4_001673 [Paraglaciecola sp.]|jgi:hypothetical protein
MSDKLRTISSVMSHIRNSGLYGALKADLGLPSLFVIRYWLDQPNDIVNLQKDIEDLRFFPERLNASYQDEWITFCKKTVSKLGLKDLSDTDLTFLADEADDDNTRNTLREESKREEALIKLKQRYICMQKSDDFDSQFEQLCLIQTVLLSKGVTVLKSEQQRKIERFIK